MRQDVLLGPETSTLWTVKEGSRQRDAREVAGVFVMFDKTSYSCFSSSESDRTLSSATKAHWRQLNIKRAETYRSQELRRGSDCLSVSPGA